MSGIYIHDMEMPTSCAECFAREISGAGAGVSLCRIIGGELDFDYDERRMKFCPLVPVPEHGRLIDADAMCERLMTAWDTADSEGRRIIKEVMADVVVPIVVSMPTIIPTDNAPRPDEPRPIDGRREIRGTLDAQTGVLTVIQAEEGE